MATLLTITNWFVVYDWSDEPTSTASPDEEIVLTASEQCQNDVATLVDLLIANNGNNASFLEVMSTYGKADARTTVTLDAFRAYNGLVYQKGSDSAALAATAAVVNGCDAAYSGAADRYESASAPMTTTTDPQSETEYQDPGTLGGANIFNDEQGQRLQEVAASNANCRGVLEAETGPSSADAIGYAFYLWKQDDQVAVNAYIDTSSVSELFAQSYDASGSAGSKHGCVDGTNEETSEDKVICTYETNTQTIEISAVGSSSTGFSVSGAVFRAPDF